MPIEVSVILPKYTLECANGVTSLVVGVFELHAWHVRFVEQSVILPAPGVRFTGDVGRYTAKFRLAELGRDRISVEEERQAAEQLRSFFGSDWTISVL